MVRIVLMVSVLAAGGAWAQATTTVTPPPLVPATPPPMPAPEPAAPPVSNQPGTPPPPSAVPPSYVPGAQTTPSGYQYSPYGPGREAEKPGPEIGLMVSESLFGMLTAAGVTVLPYFLLFGNNTFTDPTVSSVVFILIFSAVPLAVAQTQVGLANGSRHYVSETWPAALAGLVGQAGVLGLFYATGWLPTAPAIGGTPRGGSVALLMIGAIGVVPLIQMAVINLFKQPKFRPVASTQRPGEGVTLAPPVIAPILGQTNGTQTLGVNLSLLNGTW